MELEYVGMGKESVMLRRIVLSMSVFLFLGGSAGCKEEGEQVRQSYEDVVEYGKMFREKDPRFKSRKKLPGDVWQYRENYEMQSRPRLEIELDMPYNAKPEDIKPVLQKVATAGIAGGPYKAVRVRAWPRNLRRYGGIMAYYVFASDGGGWSRDGVYYRKMVTGPHRNKDVRPPTQHEYSLLLRMEEIHDQLLKEDEKLRKTAKKNPEAFREIVMERVAAESGLTTSSVTEIATKAKEYYSPTED